MLLHPAVKFSTFPPGMHVLPVHVACNGWLQWLDMRIELPSASWADTVHRADDDAHTLTVASQSASDWAPLDLLPQADAALGVHVEVAATPPLVLTLTL